jgi:hypothetical protein
MFYELQTQSQDQPALNEKLQKDSDGLRFDPKDILHIRRPNPASLWWGLSPFIPGSKAVLFNRYTTDYLNAFYLKQATPSMILSMERTVNEDLAIRQLASMEMAYAGRSNQRRTMMLPKGVKAEPINQSIADQKLCDIVIQNRETVLNLLSVPKHEVGMQESGSLGSEEHKVALRNFWQATLIPGMRRQSGGYTNFFRGHQMLADNERLEYDLDGVEALQDDLAKKAEIAKLMADTLPLNVVLDKIWKEEPIADPRADLPLSLPPVVVPPLNEFGQEGNQEPSDTGDQPNEFDTDEDGDGDGSDDDNKAFAVRWRHANDEWINSHRKALADEVDKQKDAVVDRSLDLLSNMAGVAVKLVGDKLRDDGKRFVPEGMKAAKIPSVEELLAALNDEFDRFEEDYVNDNVTTLSSSVELGYDSQMNINFKQTDRAQIDALRIRDANKRYATLTARGLKTFADVKQTQTNQIMREVIKGVEAKENIADITKRIADTFRDGQKNLFRAERIARTETLTAASIGQDAAYENVTEVLPNAERMWLNLGDERVRGNPDGLYPKAKFNHWDLEGERRKKGEKFSNGLRFPRDPEGEAGNVIQCRCTTIIIVPE